MVHASTIKSSELMKFVNNVPDFFRDNGPIVLNISMLDFEFVLKHFNIIDDEDFRVYNVDMDGICTTTYKQLSVHPMLTVDFLRTHIEHFKRYMYNCTMSPGITSDDIQKNPDLPWDIYVAANKVKLQKLKFRSHVFQDKKLAKIDNKVFKRCKAMGVTVNKSSLINDLDPMIVIKNPNEGWNWFQISSSPILFFDHVINNLALPWDPEGLVLNPNISYEFYRDYDEIFDLDLRKIIGTVNKTNVEQEINRVLGIISTNRTMFGKLINYSINPRRIERYLQKFEYNLGTDEYCMEEN